MDVLVLAAERRETRGRAAAHRLRAGGMVPAVLYGHKAEVLSLAVPGGDVSAALESGARVVTLQLDGNEESALIKEVQYDALGDDIIHVDFARVALDEKVTVHLEILLHGTPKGAQEGGVVGQPLKSLEVECLAQSVPENLRVEIGHLDIGDAVHVREIELPEGITPLIDGSTAVVIVHRPVKEAEPEPAEPAEEAAAEPERIGEKEKPAPEEEEKKEPKG